MTEVRGMSQVLGRFYLVNEGRKRNLCNAIAEENELGLAFMVTYASTKIVSRLIQKRELVEISHASTKRLRRLTKNGYVD